MSVSSFRRLKLIFLLASMLVASSLAAQVLDILPVASNPEFGCFFNSQGSTLATTKASLGENRFLPVEAAARMTKKRLVRVSRQIERLKTQENPPAKKIRRLKTRKKSLSEVRRGLSQCAAAERQSLQLIPVSFEFLCRHGFRAPTSSAEGNDCAVNLREFIDEPLTSDILGFEMEVFDGEIAVLDNALLKSCEQEGGTYQRNINLKGFFPLYHGVCQQPGTDLFVDQGEVISVLGMDADVNDCFSSPFTGIPGAGVKDPCDCYDPDAPRRPAPGGGSDPRPTPTQQDCFILRMDADTTDC